MEFFDWKHGRAGTAPAGIAGTAPAGIAGTAPAGAVFHITRARIPRYS